VHTKFIPAFLQKEELASQTRDKVEAVIDRSLQRLRQERLDLVQLHWWEYEIPGNVETALILKELQRAGKIHHIGGTNYNVAELRR
jgi:aryl-alcohol dehydrogenase-like predicted oxidoreductase